MSGSGMIPARPEGLDVDFAGEPEGCVSGWGQCVNGVEPVYYFRNRDVIVEGGVWHYPVRRPAGSIDVFGTCTPEGSMPITVGGWDRRDELWEGAGFDEEDVQARVHALGILMLGARKCAEVNALADRGAIERDGADLFIRRYSESISEIIAELVPPARGEKGS